MTDKLTEIKLPIVTSVEPEQPRYQPAPTRTRDTLQGHEARPVQAILHDFFQASQDEHEDRSLFDKGILTGSRTGFQDERIYHEFTVDEAWALFESFVETSNFEYIRQLEWLPTSIEEVDEQIELYGDEIGDRQELIDQIDNNRALKEQADHFHIPTYPTQYSNRVNAIEHLTHYDSDIESELILLGNLVEAVKFMKLNDRIRFQQRVADHLAESYPYLSAEGKESIFSLLKTTGDVSSAQQVELSKTVAQQTIKLLNTLDDLSKETFIQHDLYCFIQFAQQYPSFLRGIAALESPKERQTLCRLLLFQTGTAEFMDQTRKLIASPHINSQEQQRLKSLIMPFWDHMHITSPKVPGSNIDMYTLVDYYQEHTPTERESRSRFEQYRLWLEEWGIKPGDTVLHLACGRGFLADQLDRWSLNVHGVDANSQAIQSAQNTYPHLSKKLHVANWEHLTDIAELPLGNAKVVFMDGRDIHHVNNGQGFYRLIREINHIDKIVVNMADPRKGRQASLLTGTRQSLKDLGYLPQQLENYYQIAGSIDGETLVNRWVPPISWWTTLFNQYGYEVEEHQIEENYDQQGSNSHLFVFSRVKDLEQRNTLRESSQVEMSQIPLIHHLPMESI